MDAKRAKMERASAQAAEGHVRPKGHIVSCSNACSDPCVSLDERVLGGRASSKTTCRAQSPSAGHARLHEDGDARKGSALEELQGRGAQCVRASKKHTRQEQESGKVVDKRPVGGGAGERESEQATSK